MTSEGDRAHQRRENLAAKRMRNHQELTHMFPDRLAQWFGYDIDLVNGRVGPSRVIGKESAGRIFDLIGISYVPPATARRGLAFRSLGRRDLIDGNYVTTHVNGEITAIEFDLVAAMVDGMLDAIAKGELPNLDAVGFHVNFDEHPGFPAEG